MIIKRNGRTFRKSSYSGAEPNTQCVYVATPEDGHVDFAVEDSKNFDHGTLSFTRAEWRAFITRAKSGTLAL